MHYYLTCFFFVSLYSVTLSQVPFNQTLWNNVVKKYIGQGVREGIATNTFDYIAAKDDKDRLNYLEALKTAQIDTLNNDSAQFYAFFINVYNALAVNMIIENGCRKDVFGTCGPISSIRDISTIIPPKSVWDREAGEVGGRQWTLDEVEGHLRSPPSPLKEDPRLHAAIVCASISCPNLRNESYVPERINQQLTDNFNNFLMNDKKGMKVDQSNNEVTLSPIFDWFSQDFIGHFNESGKNQLDFIMLYLDGRHPDFHYLKQNTGKVSLKFFTYDWDTNAIDGKVPCDQASRPCYPMWALLVTIGAVVLVGVVVGIVVTCVLRRRRKRMHYTEI